MHDIAGYLKESSYRDGLYLSSYDDLVRSFGHMIVMEEDIGYYQGDILYILRNEATGAYGWYVQGYGSCSYCDELEGMQDDRLSVEEWREWQESNYERIKWYESASALYQNETANENDWYSYESDTQRFLDRFKKEVIDD